MKKLLIMSLMAISMAGLIGCQKVIKDDDLNVTVNSNSEDKDSNVQSDKSEGRM